MPSTSNQRGILAMVVAMGVFVTADSLLKLVFTTVPMFEAMFLRGVVGSALCVIATVAMGHGKDLLRIFNPFIIGRSLMEMMANTLFLFSISVMPIADVVAVVQTTPLLVLVGAALFYGEKLSATRTALILLGLVGALLVAQPGSSSVSPYMPLTFVIAFFVAARDLLTRRVPATVAAPVATTSLMIILTIAAAVGMSISRQPLVVPSGSNTSLIVLGAFLFASGQLLVFLAFKIGQARAVAPFMYTLMIWAIAFGYVLFGDVPNPLAIVGMALILITGLAVFYADRKPATI